MGEVENFEMEPPALPVGYNFVALVALIILFKLVRAEKEFNAKWRENVYRI